MAARGDTACVSRQKLAIGFLNGGQKPTSMLEKSLGLHACMHAMFSYLLIACLFILLYFCFACPQANTGYREQGNRREGTVAGRYVQVY